MTHKHTPAPWHRNIKSKDARYPVIFAGRNQHIASAKGHGQLAPEEIEANIDLIAAAPELLEALEELRDFMTEKTVLTSTARIIWQLYAVNKANAAINKARGE